MPKRGLILWHRKDLLAPTPSACQPLSENRNGGSRRGSDERRGDVYAVATVSSSGLRARKSLFACVKVHPLIMLMFEPVFLAIARIVVTKRFCFQRLWLLSSPQSAANHTSGKVEPCSASLHIIVTPDSHKKNLKICTQRTEASDDG